MEIKETEKVETIKRIASTVKADDLILGYAEGVQKFLRDNQLAMGDDWVKMAASRLYHFSGKNEQGDILGSSTDMGVAIATFCPKIPLITGQQLLGLYAQAGNKNPFGEVYIDFGAQINGLPKENPAQAKILLDDFSNRNIKIEGGRVPNLSQLRLIADQKAGLAYKLREDVSSSNIAVVSALPFCRTGKNGLFGAYIDWDGGWYALGGGLANSGDYRRVVRYDAEGVAHVKPRKPSSDLVNSLTDEFRKKF